MKVFISYKWESEEHNQWVERFATDLRLAGIDAQLDKWEIRAGDSLTDYMTSRIDEATVVLCILTDEYVKSVEAPAGRGGATKFEMQMAVSRRTAGDGLRVIGVYRQGSRQPNYLRDHLYVDFRDDDSYDVKFRLLVEDLMGTSKRPPLGPSRQNPEQQLAPDVHANSVAAPVPRTISNLTLTVDHLAIDGDAREVFLEAEAQISVAAGTPSGVMVSLLVNGHSCMQIPTDDHGTVFVRGNFSPDFFLPANNVIEARTAHCPKRAKYHADLLSPIDVISWQHRLGEPDVRVRERPSMQPFVVSEVRERADITVRFNATDFVDPDIECLYLRFKGPHAVRTAMFEVVAPGEARLSVGHTCRVLGMETDFQFYLSSVHGEIEASIGVKGFPSSFEQPLSDS